MKCDGIELAEWYDNIRYNIETVKYLKIACHQKTHSLEQKKTYSHNLAYLAGYPLEFLWKIATCLAGREVTKIHIGQQRDGKELSDFYRETVQKKRATYLLNITKLRRLGLAKFDVNKFRYCATSTYKNYGYANVQELIDDLDEIQKEADRIKKKYISKKRI